MFHSAHLSVLYNKEHNSLPNFIHPSSYDFFLPSLSFLVKLGSHLNILWPFSNGEKREATNECGGRCWWKDCHNCGTYNGLPYIMHVCILCLSLDKLSLRLKFIHNALGSQIRCFSSKGINDWKLGHNTSLFSLLVTLWSIPALISLHSDPRSTLPPYLD